MRHAWIVSVLLTLLVAACGAEDPTTVPIRTATPPPTRMDAPSPTVGPSPSVDTGIDMFTLRRAKFDPDRLTVVCGRDRTSLDHEPPRPSIVCGTSRGTALAAGLAAMESVAVKPITLLYMQGNTCPSSGCTDEAFQVATVVGWSRNGDAYRTVIDLRSATVSTPVREDSIKWPSFGASKAPAVQRPTIKAAPADVLDRSPYPFCGVARLEEPRSVARCFRDAVLDGRPAEMILHTTGAEGFPMLELYRFSGNGAVVRYRHAEGHWSRTAGTLILEGPPSVWTVDQWNGTVKNFD